MSMLECASLALHTELAACCVGAEVAHVACVRAAAWMIEASPSEVLVPAAVGSLLAAASNQLRGAMVTSDVTVAGTVVEH